MSDKEVTFRLNLDNLVKKDEKADIPHKYSFWCCCYQQEKSHNPYEKIMTPKKKHFLMSTYTPRKDTKCTIF